MRNNLLAAIVSALGGSVTNMNNRNKLLVDIVLAAGGTVTNPNDRNMLLQDWLDAAGGGPSPTPSQYDHVLYLGASIMFGAFDEDNRNAVLTTPFFEQSGYSGTQYYAYTNPGTNSIGYLSLADQFFIDNPSLTGSKLLVVHGSGGDVSDLRPYATADTQDLDDVRDNLTELFNRFKSEGYDILYTGATWRQYADVPPDSNGSEPFNENIFYPLLQEFSSEYWNSTLGKPVVNVYDLAKSLGELFFADTVHPYIDVGDYIFNTYINTQMIRNLKSLGSYDYSGKKIITCWNPGQVLDTAEFTAVGGITRWVNRYNAKGELEGRAGCSGAFDSNGERTPFTLIMGSYKPASSGKGNVGNETYSLDNNDLLSGYVSSIQDGMQDGVIWLGGSEYAGLTGKIRFIASRNSSGSNRLTDISVQGSVTKQLNPEIDELNTVEFDFVVDSDGRIEYQWGKALGQSAGYLSAIEVEFD